MVFQREQFAAPDEEVGVFIDGLGRALVTWTAMQDHIPTVAEAMAAFNTTMAVIWEAVEEASWIDIVGPGDDPTKQKLELDGE